MRYVLLFGLCLRSVCHALYNGSPALPEMPMENLCIGKDSPFSCKVGYEGDFLWGRRLKADDSLSLLGISSSLQGGWIALGFVDRCEVYSLLGAMQTTFSATQGLQSWKLHTNYGLGGEVGARAIATFWREMKLGFDAKYFYGWPHVDSIFIEGSKVDPSTQLCVQREWQVGVALSQTFAYFTPYFGAKYARFALEFRDISFLDRSILAENVTPFGLFLGIGVNGTKGLFLNGELRFLDEYGCSGVMGLRF